jgi:hypothetical protein
MFGRRSLLGIGKKAFSDPESRVIMVWGGLAFVVGYGAELFGAFLPVEFLGHIPAMKEWVARTQYGEEATVLLSFMWLSLPLVILAQVISMDWYRYLPVTLKKLVAFIIMCLFIYLLLIRGFGSDIEGYRPNGFVSRIYYGSKPGMIFLVWSVFSMTVFSISLPIVWLFGRANNRRR